VGEGAGASGKGREVDGAARRRAVAKLEKIGGGVLALWVHRGVS
jgi:hypothetical protein